MGRKEQEMKFYQAEYEAMQFMKGSHTLKEWANYGFNNVVYNGKEYYEGGDIDIEALEDDGVLLEWAERDFDDDGYIYIVLKKAE